MATTRPVRVADALEHLLDPLGPPKGPPAAGWSEDRWLQIEERRGLPAAFRLFADRLRWSRRLRYRILRLTLAAAGSIGLIWLTFALTGQA